MTQRRIPAIFMRGGSSKGVFFHEHDLPTDQAQRDQIFLDTIGSPDPYGRQLNGMGGGVSSLSKAVIIGQPSRADADLDYTFAQVAVDRPMVDYAANCGNLSSAVGPFCIDYGVLQGTGEETLVRIHNTNSSKIIHARIPTLDGKAQVAGDFTIPGVGGTGARIRLDFLDPGGTSTDALLPTGNPLDVVHLDGVGEVEMSMVDASTPVAFVLGERFGLTGAETVGELEADHKLMDTLERLRRLAAVHMGMADSPENAAMAAPKIGFVAPSVRYTTLAGVEVDIHEADLAARMLSMGNVHRVLPLTAAMCLAVACRVEGTVCHRAASQNEADVRLANPSGVLPVDARVAVEGNAWRAESVTAYRTARTLMEGHVMVPA